MPATAMVPRPARATFSPRLYDPPGDVEPHPAHTSLDELRRKLRGMEIKCKCKLVIIPCRCADKAGCQCPVMVARCPHVNDRDHGVSLERWIALLLQVFPGFDDEGYGEPATTDQPALALTRKARVALRMDRVQRQVKLWCKGDQCLDMPDDQGVEMEKGRNIKGLVTPDDEEEDLIQDEYVRTVMAPWPQLATLPRGKR